MSQEKPKNHYVDNKSFYAALIRYKNKKKEAEALGLPTPKIPEDIGLCIFQIATRLASKGNFVNYSYKDEMISDGIENCINYMHNFDPEKSNNPFAYFTRIIYNAFILRIQKEKKQTYIKYKTMENTILSGDSYEYQDTDNPIMQDVNVNDNMNVFVKDYEKKLSEKKVPKKVGIELFVVGDE
jgi:DNA-directed RNA polymerase specialized sigma subunit